MEYVDFDNICRSCTMNVDLQPIQDHFVIDLFQKLIDANYSKTDGLPQKICETCIQTIYSIQAFVLQCKTNGITLKKYLSMAKSANTVNKANNTATLVLSNIEQTVENNVNRTITNEIQPEELINDAINCSNETIDLEMNDHVLENSELSIEHRLVRLSNCVTNKDSTISNEVNMENENIPEIKTEPEETSIVNNEVIFETQFFTENNNEINNETNEINNETNATISVTVDTDIINEISSDNSNENRINDKDIEKRVNLGYLLSELKKQFNANDCIVNRELDSVSLREGEIYDKNVENVQNIFIPASHLLTFDDDIIIVDSVSSNCKREKFK